MATFEPGDLGADFTADSAADFMADFMTDPDRYDESTRGRGPVHGIREVGRA
ncbi:hypothetical protein ACFXI8_21765 [Streptomyces niveus]|uniref:hypothetical protein n=1 Tax=Streptomyces niveus TaxID=193462 RepID=UPI00368E1D0B